MDGCAVLGHFLVYSRLSVCRRALWYWRLAGWWQGWEFALSLKSLILLSNCERFALVALLKKATKRESLSSLNNMSSMSNSLMIRAKSSQKRVICLKKFIFFICFWPFFTTAFPLFIKYWEANTTEERIAPVAHCSSRSLKLRDLSNSLLSLFKIEWPWANCSYRFLQKRDHERFAQVNLYKRETMSDSLRLLMTKEQQEQFALFQKQITFWMVAVFWV